MSAQQPLDAVCAAAEHGRRAGAVGVLDGAPPDPAARADLLARADVLRADDTEAGLWAEEPIGSAEGALRVARSLLDCGPRTVVLGAGSEGNVVAWPGGAAVVPLGAADVVDTTGAGDAFTAAIVAAPAPRAGAGGPMGLVGRSAHGRARRRAAPALARSAGSGPGRCGPGASGRLRSR